MSKCSVQSSSSGKINEDNQQQVETFRSDEDQTEFTLMLCEMSKIRELLEELLLHITVITDQENLK